LKGLTHMTLQTRPRLEEFFLALLWIIGAVVWGYFGVVGYIENLSNYNNDAVFNLAGMVLSFFLLCLSVFGIRFVLNVFLRLLPTRPAELDTAAGVALSVTLFLGSIFSFVNLGLAIYKLFTLPAPYISNLIFAWGFTACVGIGILGVIQFLAALSAIEPFMGWVDQEGQPRHTSGFLSILRNIQYKMHGRNFGPQRQEDEIRGPLVLETDNRTMLHTEKLAEQPGLEKTLVAHGGYHISALGFTANGTTIFSVSDGGTVHYRAGGRKGTMFPPELKFWDWNAGRVQTATLGAVHTFLTSDYKAPAALHNYRFLVPASGGKFAWITPRNIQVGEWNSDNVQSQPVEDGLVLRGLNGFAPLAFNPDGSRFAWCGADGETRLWNLDTNQVQPLRAYPAHTPTETTGSVHGAWGLVFSPDGTRIASIGGRGLLLQNVYTGWKWFRPTDIDHERMTAFAFSNTGYEMAVGMQVKPHLMQVPQARRNGRQNGYNAPFNPTAMLESGQDELVPVLRLWDLRDERFVDLPLGSQPLRELAYSPDNKLLAGVDEAGILRLWEIPLEGSVVRTPRRLVELDLGITGRKVIITFSPDVSRLLCATDNRIMLWNVARLREANAVLKRA
jgi:WD40 repeat protein